MSTLTHNPNRNCVNSLGIPVDNLTLDSAVEEIVRLARIRDGKARLVSTLNVDFLVNSLGTRFSRARHPELLDVLRNSDLVTADGFPILWLSRIVGRPLPQRVCGSDLVPALARRGGEDKLSLFLLGGSGGVAARAAGTLQAQNPGLKIAGTAEPFVEIAGPGLVDGIANDEALVEKINASGADILLIGLGNPKQELWFNRNRDKLTVPVSIGVGGTFEFITGGVRRAPTWLQRSNLEWIYRLTQDPARLWRRYSRGLFKLAALSAPLIASRALEVTAFAGRRKDSFSPAALSTLWSSRDQALTVARLPGLVTADYLRDLVRHMERSRDITALHLIDFSRVRRIEMAGHEALFTLAELQRSRGNILLLGISQKLDRRLAACRVLDMLGQSEGSTIRRLGADVQAQNQALTCQSYVMEDAALTFLAGKADARGLARLALVECLLQTSRDRACIVDFRNVSLLESSAVAAIQPLLEQESGRVVISGANDNTRQMFRMVAPNAPIRFVDDAELLRLISERTAREQNTDAQAGREATS